MSKRIPIGEHTWRSRLARKPTKKARNALNIHYKQGTKTEVTLSDERVALGKRFRAIDEIMLSRSEKKDQSEVWDLWPDWL